MTGILPDSTNGGVIIRNSERECIENDLVQSAYCPPATFATSCPVTALPTDCTARLSAQQINAIVSELLCLMATLNPGGVYSCESVCNLASNFVAWIAANNKSDGTTIVGDGTIDNPYRVAPVGAVAAICQDSDARDNLAECLISTDTGNGLVAGASGGIRGMGTFINPSLAGKGTQDDPLRVVPPEPLFFDPDTISGGGTASDPYTVVPIVVDGSSITGSGTSESPLVAHDVSAPLLNNLVDASAACTVEDVVLITLPGGGWQLARRTIASTFLGGGGYQTIVPPTYPLELRPPTPTDPSTFYSREELQAAIAANSVNYSKLNPCKLAEFSFTLDCSSQVEIRFNFAIAMNPSAAGGGSIGRIVVSVDGAFPIVSGVPTVSGLFTNFEAQLDSSATIYLTAGSHTLAFFIIAENAGRPPAQVAFSGSDTNQYFSAWKATS